MPTRKKTRKKSWSDLEEQSRRISRLATQLGARTNNGGSDDAFDDWSGRGNMDAANRANRALNEIESRQRRIMRSKQFRNDQEKENSVYGKNGYYNELLKASEAPYNRKYGQFTQKGVNGYNSARRAMGVAAG